MTSDATTSVTASQDGIRSATDDLSPSRRPFWKVSSYNVRSRQTAPPVISRRLQSDFVKPESFSS